MSKIIFERLKVIEKKQILAGTTIVTQPASSTGVSAPATPKPGRECPEAYTTKPQCYSGLSICHHDTGTSTYSGPLSS